VTKKIWNRGRVGPAVLAALFLLLFGPVGSSGADWCGDLDYSGSVDMTDMNIFIDHFFLTHSPIPEPLADMDGISGLTHNDWCVLWNFVFNQANNPVADLDCTVIPDSSFQYSFDTVKIRGSTDIHPGLGLPNRVVVEIWFKSVEETYSLSLPFRWETDAPYCVLDSVHGVAAGIDADSQRVVLYSSIPGPQAAGERRFARLFFSMASWIDLATYDILFDTVSYVEYHTTVVSRKGEGVNGIDGFIPAFVVDPTPISCCRESTGNVNCDGADVVDVSDIQALVDHLFLTLNPLCCEAEANFNYPGSGYAETDDLVDVTDLSILIDNQFLSLSPLPLCP